MSGAQPHEEEVLTNSKSRRGCCFPRCCYFDGITEAKAYMNIGVGRGIWLSSQLFLSASLLYLASEEAHCIRKNGLVNEECKKKIHGFRPSSLISNIGLVIGLSAAILMPVFGAIVDYTPYRKSIGTISAIMFVGISVAQIYTVEATWYKMAWLMAFNAIVYDVQILTGYAYLPLIAEKMGEKAITKFASNFYAVQFTVQLLFIALISAISFKYDLNDVRTCHISQFIASMLMTVFLGIGWYQMPSVESNSRKPTANDDDVNLFTIGFKQVWNTAKSINRYYSKGCKWFFLSVCFTVAALETFTLLAVVYLHKVLDMDANQIGIVFIITGFTALPGSKFGECITHCTNANASMKLCLSCFVICNIAAAFVIDRPENAEYAYVFGALWGILFGWYYPAEKVFFSMCLPKGQDAELTGFYIYCENIIAWCPPLAFTVCNELGMPMQWGLLLLCVPFLISICLLSCTASWEEIIAEANTTTWQFGGDTNDTNIKDVEYSTPGATSNIA